MPVVGIWKITTLTPTGAGVINCRPPRIGSGEDEIMIGMFSHVYNPRRHQDYSASRASVLLMCRLPVTQPSLICIRLHFALTFALDNPDRELEITAVFACEGAFKAIEVVAGIQSDSLDFGYFSP